MITRTLLSLVAFPLVVATHAQDLSALFARLDPTVVTIEVVTLQPGPAGASPARSLGAGVIIGTDGTILTAAHVVNDADRISVQLADGRSFKAEIVRSIPAADVALIKLLAPPQGLVVALPGNSDQVKTGQPVMVIGAPFGLSHSLSAGLISRTMERRMVFNGQMVGLIQTDAAINHGNSGGPMFDLDGNLLGIISFIVSESGGSDGVGFAVGISAAQRILAEDNAFWTGFDGVFIGAELAALLNVPQGAGVLVQHVVTGSFADRLGLRAGSITAELQGVKVRLGGDIILNIQGSVCTEPHAFNTIRERIAALGPGEVVIVTVLRAGKEMELSASFQ